MNANTVAPELPGAPQSGQSSYLARRVRSFGHALSGIGFMVSTQPHARLHVLATLIVGGTGWWLSISLSDWMMIAIVCGMVLAAEAINTAMEHLCDVVCPAWNENVRRTKDVAAGAVLISAATAAIVGLLIVVRNLS